MADTQSDPFDSLLNLEDEYFTEGYSLGVSDGTRAGRIEGRIFGLEKGYEKALEMGRLGGKAQVWQTRLQLPTDHQNQDQQDQSQTTSIKPLKGSERLRKHIERLAELTEPESLETENEEEAVNEFDERLAGAKAKTTLISKIVGESSSSSSTPFVDGGGVSSPGRAGGQSATAAKEMPSSPDEGVEVDMTHAVRPASGSRGAKPPKRSGEMEDFVGLPQVKKASN
ncbi:hypothetical protein KC332_g13394 [Hortaea werneckii]|uniref:Essential protein Yae1 N-terminal domain-containing protein n=2 Tax=Hortaea werneckii TaxID=91943 RepID=A0A3M7IFK0_HORWE|nr:hypothetical protein KC358_g10795 [Hortaea werneckii]OTA30688.1 hypothetical protein BTJ68_09675 [Hortaea werneckii EXF-2000]KAI6909694.1 hypothetical protein KC348_g13428 [Hortaea werneckii]KAI6936299.1 hypothetical protein KC341_g6333 [Hortaea werneckii]KAI6969634.1 hypothetical protein KC321_g7782 [Hortaea werneckii]